MLLSEPCVCVCVCARAHGRGRVRACVCGVSVCVCVCVVCARVLWVVNSSDLQLSEQSSPKMQNKQPTQLANIRHGSKETILHSVLKHTHTHTTKQHPQRDKTNNPPN